MSVVYNDEHGIAFWKKTIVNNHTIIDQPKFSWDDFHLIPDPNLFIALPSVNYQITNIPGSSKRFNSTNTIPGGKTFGNRTGTWSFLIDHDQWTSWVKALNDMEEYFHGSRMIVALNDDPTEMFEGRIVIQNYTPGNNYSSITLSYDLDAEKITDHTGMQCRIRFFGQNNALLRSVKLAYGKTPFYSDLNVSKWSPYVRAVDGNRDYHAVFG